MQSSTTVIAKKATNSSFEYLKARNTNRTNDRRTNDRPTALMTPH